MAVRGPGVDGPEALARQLFETRVTAGETAAPPDPDGWLIAMEARAPEAARRARRLGRTADDALKVTLALAADALAGAALDPDGLAVVVAGSNLQDERAFRAFEKYAAEPAYLSPRHGFEYLDTHVMAAVAEVVGARGPGLTVGGASASGNGAILAGLDLVRSGRAAAALVIAPPPRLSPAVRQALATMGALADPPVCRPLDRAARGFVPGDVAGALLLEAEASARVRGAAPLAEIAGAALVLGASHLPDPDVDGAVRAMNGALRDGCADVAAIDLVSAHATSTPAGDAAECEALRKVLGARARDVPVNAPKALLGHGLQAAGIVEAIAVVLQMHGGRVHGTAGLAEPIADDLWLVGPAPVRRPVRLALSNGFGFGSISTSVCLRRVEGVA